MATSAATTAQTTSSAVPALREALLTAFVAFILLAPMLGMRTTSGPTGMTLAFHFEWVLLLTGLVFVGRLALTMLEGAGRGFTTPAPLVQAGKSIAASSYWLAAAGLVFALVLPFLPFANRYVVDIATSGGS